MHHSTLGRFFWNTSVSVSIRNHIVTGFNQYPDGTCRARHRHHPLVSILRFFRATAPLASEAGPVRPPVSTNSGQSRKRSVSRASDSQPAVDLNSAGLNDRSIPATRRVARRLRCHALSGSCVPLNISERLSNAIGFEDVDFRLQTLPQAEIINADFKPAAGPLIEIKASTDFDHPTVVKSYFTIMHIRV